MQLTKQLNALAQTGFSLVEMAVVLAIVGLLLGGLIPSISGQFDQQHRNETRKQMEEIKDALTGFAVSKGYLPCPASQVSGIEDRNSTTLACNGRTGFLPWSTIGVTQVDGWGRVYLYGAKQTFTAASSVFSTSTTGDITIKKLDGSTLGSAIPAVIVSPGSNGIYGTTDSNITIPSAAPNSFTNVSSQIANIKGQSNLGLVYFSDSYTARSASNDEDFDDLVVWISPNILFNRMVAAGKLP